MSRATIASLPPLPILYKILYPQYQILVIQVSKVDFEKQGHVKTIERDIFHGQHLWLVVARAKTLADSSDSPDYEFVLEDKNSTDSGIFHIN